MTIKSQRLIKSMCIIHFFIFFWSLYSTMLYEQPMECETKPHCFLFFFRGITSLNPTYKVENPTGIMHMSCDSTLYNLLFRVSWRPTLKLYRCDDPVACWMSVPAGVRKAAIFLRIGLKWSPGYTGVPLRDIRE
jgi:hypothetical protein